VGFVDIPKDCRILRPQFGLALFSRGENNMVRFLDKHLLILLLALAMGVTVACSSSSTDNDAGPEGAPDAMTQS
jgi:hypothetical protein